MRKAEIKIGGRYAAKVSNKIVTVRITGMSHFGGWNAINETTGRSVRIKSAAKLRYEIKDELAWRDGSQGRRELSKPVGVNMRFGVVLPNGCTVVEASCRYAHEWVLLARKPERLNPYEPWVTWRCSRPGDGSDTHTGHYFNSLSDAVADFLTR